MPELGECLINLLIKGGVIQQENVSRVVLDINCEGMVRIFIEAYPDLHKLDVNMLCEIMIKAPRPPQVVTTEDLDRHAAERKSND